MKILITGSKGQLGNELQDQLKSGKSEIGNIPKELLGAEVVAIDVDTLDITDAAAVDKFVSEVKPDVIINCAALTDVNGCESKQELAMKVNAEGPHNLAVSAEKYGAKVVQISTDYVFSGDSNVPYVETDKTGPVSTYGRTKLRGEELVRESCKRHFIIRTSWLYGYIGNNFVKTMMKLGRERGGAKVVNDQIGNPTSAADLAHHILLLIVTEYYGTYHCTGEGVCSWYDFACKIIEFSGIDAKMTPCTTEEFPTPAHRPAFSHLENKALKETVGNYMRDWETALRVYINKLKSMEENS